VLVCDSQGQPVDAGRIKADAHIGKMAVLKGCRGQDIGAAMLNALLQ
jgi:GNAT superfamily N-acetyltransferase